MAYFNVCEPFLVSKQNFDLIGDNVFNENLRWQPYSHVEVVVVYLQLNWQ